MSSFEPKPFGKYFLMDKLAVGGMAEIYKAKTFGVDGFEKLLAIKKILPHCSADKEFIAMLTDEAKLAVRLSHTNIVQIYDLGKVGDDYYISMEFIDGVNLRDLLNRAKELKETIPIPVCLYIISETCKGLDYAHSKRDENSRPLNIVHRDISPQNILISFEGEAKIVDFGIAKAAMNMSQTTSGILKGKVTYMSPEQALGKVVDQRTDIFSTGLILYELLTGHKLFSGESQFQVLKQIQTSQVKADNLPNTIPPDVRHIMAKALAYDTQKRFETAGDFQIALTKLLYTKYSDFSPKQLATLIQKWFAPELKIRQIQIHEKTSGGSLTQPTLKQPSQETLVHRPVEVESKEKNMMDTTQSESRLKSLEFKSKILEPPLPQYRRRRPFIPLILLTLLIGGAVFFLYKKFIPHTPVAGEIEILSDPAGAEVFLNGQDTQETTPYIVKNIQIPKVYKVHLEKKNFEAWDREVTLENKKPLTVNATLIKEAEPTSGSVIIHSDPAGAKIYLDGVIQDKVTPATIHNLTKGQSITVRLELAGFQPVEQTTTIAEDKPVTIDTTLKETPLGSLSLTSDPSGARVMIDGKDAEQVTPLTFGGLDFPKTYHLQLSKKDYQDLTQDIEIKNSDPLQLNLVLQKTVLQKTTPQTGRLVIQSNVDQAEVMINGQKVGQTPYTYEGTAGSLKITLSKKGFTSSTKKLALHDGNNESVTMTLREESTVPVNPVTPQTKQQPQTPVLEKGNMGVNGQVRIDSTPRGASVVFDGGKAGITPIVLRNMTSGNHTVVLSLPGYQTWSHSFNLTKGSLEISPRLQKN